MFILLLTVFAVVLSSGEVIPLVPPRVAVIKSFATLALCEDARIYVNDGVATRPEEVGTFVFECKDAKKIQ